MKVWRGIGISNLDSGEGPSLVPIGEKVESSDLVKRTPKNEGNNRWKPVEADPQPLAKGHYSMY